MNRNQHYNSPVYIPNIPGSIVPPTPGPKTIEAIQNDARDRFAGIILIQKGPDRSLEDYFLEYDYWEPYSETKPYSKRIYQAAYKGVMRDYNNFLCILNTDQGDEHYVLAKRIRNELETLEPYCTCSTCSACILNPLKYIWCPTCTKCIKAGPGFANQQYIDKARILKVEAEQRKKSPSKYAKYIEGTQWIKATEAAVAAGLVVIALYSYIF
ncbi:Hypothetical protein HVR_LOCUS549 [uncultured virus]|nr:Hypothetical protein HVR_LOCUS549 [uncultured virus]